jgi:plastocyanin
MMTIIVYAHDDCQYKIVYNSVRTIRQVLAVKTTRKFAGLLLLDTMSVALAGSGCAIQAVNAKTANSTGPSATAITSTAPAITDSSIESTVVDTTDASPSYEGLSIPAKPGEAPAEICTDGYECFPNVLTVAAGTTVTWVNLHVKANLVVSDDPSLFEGYIYPSFLGYGIAGGQTFSFLFSDPGTFGWSLSPDKKHCLVRS